VHVQRLPPPSTLLTQQRCAVLQAGHEIIMQCEVDPGAQQVRVGSALASNAAMQANCPQRLHCLRQAILRVPLQMHRRQLLHLHK
jgi:hypothetical protein